MKHMCKEVKKKTPPADREKHRVPPAFKDFTYSELPDAALDGRDQMDA